MPRTERVTREDAKNRADNYLRVLEKLTGVVQRSNSLAELALDHREAGKAKGIERKVVWLLTRVFVEMADATSYSFLEDTPEGRSILEKVEKLAAAYADVRQRWGELAIAISKLPHEPSPDPATRNPLKELLTLGRKAYREAVTRQCEVVALGRSKPEKRIEVADATRIGNSPTWEREDLRLMEEYMATEDFSAQEIQLALYGEDLPREKAWKKTHERKLQREKPQRNKFEKALFGDESSGNE